VYVSISRLTLGHDEKLVWDKKSFGNKIFNGGKNCSCLAISTERRQ
jgi:hypothetical protein